MLTSLCNEKKIVTKFANRYLDIVISFRYLVCMLLYNFSVIMKKNFFSECYVWIGMIHILLVFHQVRG